MIGLSADHKDGLLAFYVGKTFMANLFNGDRELDIERQPVTFSSPQGDDVRFVCNVGEVRWPPVQQDETADHWGIFDTEGTLHLRYRLVQPRDVLAGDNYVAHPGLLEIAIP
jgi:hypothetical protein